MSGYQNSASTDKLLNDGLILFGLGKFEEAIVCWKRVLELSPNDSLAREYLEIAYEEIGRGSETAAAEETSQDPIKQGLELLKQGKLEKAHAVFKLLLEINEENPEVHGYEVLVGAHRLEHYTKLIGNLDGVPRVVMEFEKIKTLDLTKETGFVLSLIDGISSCEDILTTTRMDKLDAMGHLASLIERGVVRIE